MSAPIPPPSSVSYHRVADDLRRAVTDGTYPPGTSLPTERLLATDYHCGRDTLRRAVAVLVYEGLLVKARGRHTLVRPPVARIAVLLPPQATVTARPATHPELEEFGCTPGTPVFEVHGAEDERVVYPADRYALKSASSMTNA
jgi:DNA-binding GntR family transcriptional regulator